MTADCLTLPVEWGEPGTASTVPALVHSCLRGTNMADRTCSIVDCNKPSVARGWCSSHYSRWHSYGDPLGTSTFRLAGDTPEQKLLLNHTVDPDSGCWRWNGSVQRDGYGVIRAFGSNMLTHRLAHELWIGPIPQGLTIDHVAARGCVHRNCFNPAHLEAVTHAENVARGRAGEYHRTRTECAQGHPFDEANTRQRRDGARACRICSNEFSRRARQRAKDARRD